MRAPIILALLSAACLSAGDAAPRVLDPGLLTEVFIVPEPTGGNDNENDNENDGAGAVKFAPADGSLRADHRRIDLLVDHETGAGAPAKGRYAVRWTGVLRVPTDGAITLILVAGSNGRVMVGDKTLTDSSGKEERLVSSGTTTLTAGEHPIRIDFCEEEGDGRVQLAWRRGDALPELVPADALAHVRADGLPSAPASDPAAALVTETQRAQRATDLRMTLIEGLIEERRDVIAASSDLAARKQALDDARKAIDDAQKAFEDGIDQAASTDQTIKDLKAAAEAIEKERGVANGDGDDKDDGKADAKDDDKADDNVDVKPFKI